MCSGANMDFDRLRFVSERADSSETLISATIPERPGAFQVRHAEHATRLPCKFVISPRILVCALFESERAVLARLVQGKARFCVPSLYILRGTDTPFVAAHQSLVSRRRSPRVKRNENA